MLNPSEYHNHIFARLRTLFGNAAVQPDHTDDLPVIDDPLAWQDMIDNAPAPINMRGAARFWKTVEHLLGKGAVTDGAPEFSTVVIQLSDTVGLQLKCWAWDHEDGEAPGGWIDYRFVKWPPEG